jgi:flavodoxin
MNVVIVYDSQFGNTEKLAMAMADKLAVGGTAHAVPARAEWPDLTGVDLLLVGGPTQMHSVSPTMHATLEHLPPHALRDVLAASFDTRVPGMKLLTGSAANGIAHWLEQKGARVLEPHESFLVLGKEGPLLDGEVERACAWALAIREQALEATLATI